ncbi:MAG TPA: hypothetical protein VD866_07200 [Urbifossiella sp.]|nr:hypothetical protein [Urbifossiella sp.]
MIRGVSTCPYCGDLSAGVDDDRPSLVLAPDRAGGRPCPHLAFLCVSLTAYDPDTHDKVPGRTGHWLWTPGDGTRALPTGPIDPLSMYVDEVMCGMLAGESLPAGEHRVGGATAGFRDADRPGSGEFPLARQGGHEVAAYLDGHGLYARNPDALVAEIRRLAGVG